MEKTLILLTSGYPYGIYDDFLHNEIQFLKKEFKEIHFLIPEYTSHLNLRELDFEFSISKVKKMNKFSFLFLNPKSIFFAIQDLHLARIKISIQTFKTALDYQLNAKSYEIAIKKIVEDQKNNFLLYSYWFDFRALSLSYLKKKNPNHICFSRAHGYDIYTERQPYQYQPFKKNLNLLDRIYPISDTGNKYINERYNISKNKIQTSRLGVFSSEFIKNTGSQNSIKILSCSNLVIVKRIHLIIETLSLFEHKLKIEWIHIGDGDLKIDLEDLAKKSLYHPVSFSFIGELKNCDVRKLYLKFKPNLFINTSSSEGIPVSIMEAMSFGIPVVATNVGGTSEIVNNENGVLLSENPTPLEIKAAIEEVIAHPEKGEVAYKTWKEKYNAEKNYTEFVNQLKSI